MNIIVNVIHLESNGKLTTSATNIPISENTTISDVCLKIKASDTDHTRLKKLLHNGEIKAEFKIRTRLEGECITVDSPQGTVAFNLNVYEVNGGRGVSKKKIKNILDNTKVIGFGISAIK